MNDKKSVISSLILSEYKKQNLRENLRKINGVVYTPVELAKYVAIKSSSYLDFSNQLAILDPACGDGELLNAVWSGITPQLQKKILLFGVDIDPEAINSAEERLPSIFKGIVGNGLCPYDHSCDEGWKILKNKFSLNSYAFDLIIANPPWGADVKTYHSLIENSCFTLSFGQYDTSDLFIEIAYRQLKIGGILAFIIPDSLFYQERSRLREFLLKNFEICFIGRFGEGVFPEVNRACAVIICRKSLAKERHMIECVRVSGDARKDLLNNNISFFDAEYRLSHLIPQKRFLDNKDFLFNIDVDESLNYVYSKITNNSLTLDYYLQSSRGVELSKKGNVVKCHNCENLIPLPKKKFIFARVVNSVM